MSQRMLAIIALLAFVVLVMGVLLTGGKLGLADAPIAHFLPDRHRLHRRRLFSGRPGAWPAWSAIPWAWAAATPPRSAGRPGVVLSARTSLGGADNIRTVNGGLVDSGFADGDAIAAAVAGQSPFRRKAAHLRVIAALFPGRGPSGGGGQIRHPDGGGFARQAGAAGPGQYQQR